MAISRNDWIETQKLYNQPKQDKMSPAEAAEMQKNEEELRQANSAYVLQKYGRNIPIIYIREQQCGSILDGHVLHMLNSGACAAAKSIRNDIKEIAGQDLPENSKNPKVIFAFKSDKLESFL